MEPSAELRDIIAGWFESVERGDVSWVDHHVSRDTAVRLVGTDPNEWLEGEDVAQFLKEEVQTMGGQVRITPGHAEAFREGGIGWGIIRPTITLPDGREVTPRWSAVFHQENGEWRLVQLHASVGVSNEELFGS
ncbi:MAG: nuclear transport factor 2 family protein [Chloroflexota bacterium]|nr:nuclear transport factor 2 family protein [Chloroflexota bacterium]